MRYLSLFSGIDAASVAWADLGWHPVAFCEIDSFPSAVLSYRFPDVPNLGDITKVDWERFREEYGAIDLIVGGSPCQSFSVAGRREGLDGESGLMFEYLRAVRDVRPRWVVWENVPGVFSIDNGRAFGTLITALQDLGYGVAWRVLDAQFVRVAVRDSDGRITGWVGPVAQRRRRVFLVGCFGEVGSAAAVLFERDSLRGNTTTSREKREELAAEVRGRADSAISIQGGGTTSQSGNGFGVDDSDVSYTLNCIDRHAVYAKSRRAASSDDYETWVDGEVSNTLNTFDIGDKRATELVAEPIAFKFHQGAEARTLGDDVGVSPTITTDWHQPAVTVADDEGCLNPYDVQSKRVFTPDSVSPTLSSGTNEGMNIQPCVLEPICMAPSFSKRPGQQIATTEGGASYALTTGEPPRVLI